MQIIEPEEKVKYFNELTNTAILMEEVGELDRIMANKVLKTMKKIKT